MIHVRIEMWPLGDQSKARHMGTIQIANDGTGTREKGNYKVRLSRMDSPTRAWKSLAITGFNRVTRGPHDLLLLALLSGVGQRNKRLIDQLKEEYGETPAEDGLTAADYEEVLADHRRLVREIDVLLNGEAGAAKQASLCDIVAQLRRSSLRRKDDGTPPAGPVPTTYVECRECDSCGHTGMNDEDGWRAACNTCRWTGDAPEEDKCPDCKRTGTMSAACPKCGERYRLIASKDIATTSPAVPQPVADERVHSMFIEWYAMTQVQPAWSKDAGVRAAEWLGDIMEGKLERADHSCTDRFGERCEPGDYLEWQTRELFSRFKVAVELTRAALCQPAEEGDKA